MSDPMNYIGQPIPDEGREAGYQACRDMGYTAAESMRAVNVVADNLERDRPFEAQKAWLEVHPNDLTSYYRLAATLLASVAVLEEA
jgi:hypothetical protein